MKQSMNVLWTLVVATVVVELANVLITFPFALGLLVILPATFALLHGALRYRWSGILTFLVLCLVVSNVLENSSILTGFPFGHYHYTNVLGPKLFLVPVLIGLSYFSVGYFSWVLCVCQMKWLIDSSWHNKGGNSGAEALCDSPTIPP